MGGGDLVSQSYFVRNTVDLWSLKTAEIIGKAIFTGYFNSFIPVFTTGPYQFAERWRDYNVNVCICVVVLF